MPHPNAPLSYPPSKAVLQHMDPNQRILLVNRCPELKTPDRVLPQRIESISVGPARITINNTTYQLGVIRQYPQGAAVPRDQEVSNNGGGTHYDVDRYGFRIPTPEVTPGDFPITVFQENNQNFYREALEGLEQRLREMMQKRGSMEGVNHRRNHLEALNKDIAGMESEVVRYRLKTDNNDRDIPFTLFLQLTISTNGPDGKKVQHIERLQYTGNLSRATKYLIDKLLKEPINVNELRISPLNYTDCLWLPAEMKLTARHLIIERYYEAVIRTVGEFFRRINSRLFQSIGHLSSGRLTIKQIDPSIQIHTLRYHILHFDFCPDYTNFRPLIDHWVRNGAPINTYYTAYTTPRQGSDWYDNMKRREEHTVAEYPTRGRDCLPDCVILPLPNNTQLEFYITSIEHHRFTLQLNLEVQPRN